MVDKYICFDEHLDLVQQGFHSNIKVKYLDFIRIQNEKNKFYEYISVQVYDHNINENEYLVSALVEFSTHNFTIIIWNEPLIETIKL